MKNPGLLTYGLVSRYAETMGTRKCQDSGFDILDGCWTTEGIVLAEMLNDVDLHHTVRKTTHYFLQKPPRAIKPQV